MPTIHVEAELSQDELFKAVEQLDSTELARFVSQVLALRAKREAPAVSESESLLLLRINRGLPEELGSRYRELIAKRGAETLEQDELAELHRLTDRAEALEVDRVSALADLARSRGVPLHQLMDDLGIPVPSDGS